MSVECLESLEVAVKNQFISLKQKNVERIVSQLVGSDDALSAVLSASLLNNKMTDEVASTLVQLYNENKEYEAMVFDEMEMTLDPKSGDIVSAASIKQIIQNQADLRFDN